MMDTGMEIFTPEGFEDLKTGGKNLVRTGKALTRGVVSNAADYADLSDALNQSSFGRFMSRNATPQGIYRQITGQPEKVDDRYQKLSEKLRGKYNSLLEKDLSPIEAQNVMEDFMEQLGVHIDEFGVLKAVGPMKAGLKAQAKAAVAPGMQAAGTAINGDAAILAEGYAEGDPATMDEIQKYRGTNTSELDAPKSKGVWKDVKQGVRVFEGVRKKNVPTKHEPITL